ASFFLTVATCWSVLVASKFWTKPASHTLGRRVVMLCLGAGIGLLAMWLEGWPVNPPRGSPSLADVGFTIQDSPLARGTSSQANIRVVASHVCYFALALFALRWWKLAERQRQHRFSLAPVLLAGLLGYLLLQLWRDPNHGALVLASSAAIVQLVS